MGTMVPLFVGIERTQILLPVVARGPGMSCKKNVVVSVPRDLSLDLKY